MVELRGENGKGDLVKRNFYPEIIQMNKERRNLIDGQPVFHSYVAPVILKRTKLERIG